MGNNCWSQTEDRPEINTQRKISLKSKHGTQNIEQEDLHFKEDSVTTQYIQYDLYSNPDQDGNYYVDIIVNKYLLYHCFL